MTERRRADRRTFLGRAGLALGAVAVGGVRPAVAALDAEPAPPPAVDPAFPQQPRDLVREIVGLSHRDLEGVRRLVTRWPELAKAAWDWGYGDWETALGAASHTGQREIAELLLAHGAQPTLFSATMLGQLAVVQAFVAASPGIQRLRGPHGISLLEHAEAGGERAAAVRAWLAGLGDAGLPGEPAAGPPETYVGTYRFGTGAGDVLEVRVGSFGLEILRLDGIPRRLAPVGQHVFHPAGAPSVRVRFEVAASPGARATAVAIDAAATPLVRARRAV